MKQDILGMPIRSYHKMLSIRTAICIGAAVFAVGLNLIFTLFRTEQTHLLMLWLNILTDILCGTFLLAFSDFRILPQRRLYKLALGDRLSFRGTVSDISDSIVRYTDMDCRLVDMSGHKFYVPIHTINLEKGAAYTVSVASNIIVEAEQ